MSLKVSDLPLPFIDGHICLLDGYAFRTVQSPPRTVGGAWFSTQLSGMTTRVLSLRLDGEIHSFEEARGSVKYRAWQYITRHGVEKNLESCTPRVIAIHLSATPKPILRLIDEQSDKTIVVIDRAITFTWILEK